MLDKAISIATNAHLGQVDKAGQPYILHPLRVMFTRIDETEKICAVLHDVIEDTDITLDYLRNEGFSEDILSTLDSLTKRKDENYEDYINRVIRNKISCHVKLADLCDNMNLARIPNPTQKDYDRINKYKRAVQRIYDALDELHSETVNTIDIEIDGCVSIPSTCSEDEFSYKFIEFLENNNWSFCGGIVLAEQE